MGKKSTKYEGILRYKGTFNFHGLYERFFSSLRAMEYEVNEKQFKQAAGEVNFDVEMKIEGQKKVDMDFKYVIKTEIKFTLLDLDAINPDNEGTVFGSFQMTWSASSEYDYLGRFSKGTWNKRWGKLYKFLKNPKDDQLRAEAYQFENDIKNYLNMKFDKV